MIHKEDPPTTVKVQRDIDWRAYVSEMKSNPNVFHNVGDFSPGISHYLRLGKNAAFLPEGYDGDAEVYMRQHWEITSRTLTREPHRVAVYCRYLP